MNRPSAPSARLKGYLLSPRLNPALSEYLKTSRARTGASVALTIAAAAGVGAASTVAGAQPWTASLNSMARAGHTAGPADSSRSAGQVAGTHAAPAAPVTPVAPAAHGPVKVDADHKADPKAAPQKAPAAGLLPLRKNPVAVRKPAAPAAPAHKALVPNKAPAAPSQPYTIYDSTTPGQIPSGQQIAAVYANGSYQASWSSVHGRHRVLWIDTNGGNPGCDVLDVEPGDASPSTAASWVKAREKQQPGAIAIVYTMRNEWSAVKSAVNSLPGSVKSHVRYWIADPTGHAHIVPGSSATQWSWGTNYDTTEALPGFDG